MKLHDVVEVVGDCIISKGSLGTIVEDYGLSVYVEFSDFRGYGIALATLKKEDLELIWECP